MSWKLRSRCHFLIRSILQLLHAPFQDLDVLGGYVHDGGFIDGRCNIRWDAGLAALVHLKGLLKAFDFRHSGMAAHCKEADIHIERYIEE